MSVAIGLAVGLVTVLLLNRPNSGGGGLTATNTAASTDSQAQLDQLQAQVAQLARERNDALEQVSKLLIADSSRAAAAAVPGSCPDRHTPFEPTAERDRLYPELAEFLKTVRALGCYHGESYGCGHCVQTTPPCLGHGRVPSCTVCWAQRACATNLSCTDMHTAASGRCGDSSSARWCGCSWPLFSVSPS